MGRDKARVPFRGRPMVEHVASALTAAGLDVLVVGRQEELAGLPAIPDMVDRGSGPALGLLSAFEALEVDTLFLVAVDQPLLRPATASRLLALPGDIVVPIADGHPQVTCAVYRRACHQPLSAMLLGGRFKLRHLLDLVECTKVPEQSWTRWGEDGRSWRSLDTPEAVREAEAQSAGRKGSTLDT